MSASNRFSRVLSLRDKRHPHKNRSNDTDFAGLFTLDGNSKKISKDEEKKIHELSHQLAALGFPPVAESRLGYVIRRASSDGDIKNAFNLLMLFEDSIGGILKPYNPNIKMLGAENREKVTCYLDALLFAMFAKADVFDAILFNNFSDGPRTHLITVLRLWVNMLRTGRLITTDITQYLQEAIADCGWPEAARLRQQDASEAFGFLTDELNLPLLTLQTDLFHSGKEDASDDHKFVSERLLNVAIPEDTQHGVVTLEHCLEEYFNNRVEVKRELERRNTLQPGISRTDSSEKSSATHIEMLEVEPATPSPMLETQKSPFVRPIHMRERATSIFSQRRVEITTTSVSEKEEGLTPTTETGTGRSRGNSIRKEVLMPAWQFISLIPWYADNVAGTANQTAAHFSSKRPMLGICLKRYVVSKTGTTSRLGTHVDIPLEMAPPYFAVDTDNNSTTDSPSTSNFKLVLQSVVCHRGNTVYSGHYVALVRVGRSGTDPSDSFADVSNGRSKNQRHDKWIMLDDLAAERVKTIDINKALHDECPYLLFYRVQPIDSDSPEDEPPPYMESEGALTAVDEKLAHIANHSQTSLDIPEWHSRRASTVASEGFFPSDESRGINSQPDDQRSSIAFTDGSTAPSVQNDAGSTEPSHAHAEDGRSLASSLSRQTTRSKTNRPLSKIASRLSRDKLGSSPDLSANDGNFTNSVGESLKKSQHDDVARGRVKEKKGKIRSKHAPKDHRKEPDRECTVM